MSEKTRRLLETLKRELGARSFDQVIWDLISERKKIPRSMFGSNTKLRPYSSGEEAEDALSCGDSFPTAAFVKGKLVSEREFGRILGLVSDWGVETSPEEVDQVLYGTRNVRHRKMGKAAEAMDRLRESTKTPGLEWSCRAQKMA